MDEVSSNAEVPAKEVAKHDAFNAERVKLEAARKAAEEQGKEAAPQ